MRAGGKCLLRLPRDWQVMNGPGTFRVGPNARLGAAGAPAAGPSDEEPEVDRTRPARFPTASAPGGQVGVGVGVWGAPKGGVASRNQSRGPARRSPRGRVEYDMLMCTLIRLEVTA